MSASELGGQFDIHGGGLDLRFPHHENEQAQSWSTGRKFAKYWMHSAWVTAKGEKMSKSLGNGLNVSEVLNKQTGSVDAYALRYALATVHYRSMLEWTKDTMQASITAGKRLYATLTASQNSSDLTPELPENQTVPEQFALAMNDDFNVSKALSELYMLINQNKSDLSLDLIMQIRKALDILGLDPLSNHWKPCFESNDTFSDVQIGQIEEQIKKRNEAKKNKDFALADQIRDQLLEQNIRLVDSADGTKYFYDK
jgi:cysteinyl-tRNA synthetase